MVLGVAMLWEAMVLTMQNEDVLVLRVNNLQPFGGDELYKIQKQKCLRKEMKCQNSLNCFIGIISNGGEKPNIIPEVSELRYFIRSRLQSEHSVLRDKFVGCVEAAAKATGCTVCTYDTTSTGNTYLLRPSYLHNWKYSYTGKTTILYKVNPWSRTCTCVGLYHVISYCPQNQKWQELEQVGTMIFDRHAIIAPFNTSKWPWNTLLCTHFTPVETS